MAATSSVRTIQHTPQPTRKFTNRAESKISGLPDMKGMYHREFDGKGQGSCEILPVPSVMWFAGYGLTNGHTVAGRVEC